MAADSLPRAAPRYRPSPAEAQFIGEVLNLNPQLAVIARGMLAKGQPLDSVVATFKAALAVAQSIKEPARER